MKGIIITDNKVEKMIIRSEIDDSEFIILPENNPIDVGDDINFYKEDYTRKTPTECINEGLLEEPTSENEIISWVDGKWKVVIDHNKELWWYKHNQNSVHTYPGFEPDDSMTQVPPPKNNPSAVFDESLGIWQVPFDLLQTKKYQEIKESFEYEKAHGVITSTVLNAEINARESDLVVIEGLIDYMERHSLTESAFRLYDNTFQNATLQQVRDVKSELIDHGMSLHQKKWNLEAQIKAATNSTELEGITW